MKNSMREEKKWLLIVLFLFLFLIFLICKIYGFWDFTGKYQIRAVFCEKDYANLLLTLDGEKKTTWGIYEEYTKDDNFVITFRNKRNVSRVGIYNAEADVCRTRPIEIYVAEGTSGWIPCNITVESPDVYTTWYVLDSPVEAEQLLLHYVDEEKGYWPITELSIE